MARVVYSQSDDVTGVGPALECLLVHVVSVEVAGLVRVWIDMLIIVVFPGTQDSLLEQRRTRRSSWCWRNLF